MWGFNPICLNAGMMKPQRGSTRLRGKEKAGGGQGIELLPGRARAGSQLDITNALVENGSSLCHGISLWPDLLPSRSLLSFLWPPGAQGSDRIAESRYGRMV